MRDEAAWQPSKLRPDLRRDAWVPNRAYVAPSSWFVCAVLAEPYARALTAHARGRLLDAGCGDVPYYGLYRPHVSAITCVDWPSSSHANRHVDQAVNLNEPLPFADGSFDTVLLADVLEHIARPAELLRETARLLAPGGTALVMVPFLYWIHEAPHDYYRYTEYALTDLVTSSGLAVVSLEPYGGLPDVCLDLTSKALVRGRRRAALYVALFGRLQNTRAYRRLRARTARVFPLGYVLVACRPDDVASGPAAPQGVSGQPLKAIGR